MNMAAAKKKEKIVLTKGKKKKAVARARFREGKGSIRINRRLIETLSEEYMKEIILEPIKLAERILGKNFNENLAITINIQGGGTMGQAHAARTALGKALIEWTKNDKLKELFLSYDRSIIIDDVRQKEPKKFLRKGARAKGIKSYR